MKAVLFFVKKLSTFAGKALYINLLGILFISLLEGAGIFLVIPLIALTGIFNLNTYDSIPFSWLSSFFGSIPETISLLIILCSYILIMIGQSYFQKRQTITNMKIQQGYIRYLKEEVNKSLLEASWSFYLKRRKSDLINMMTSEIGKVGNGTYLFLQFLSSIVFTFIQLAIAFWLSAQMTTYILIFGLFLIYFARKFIKKSNSIGKDAFELNKNYIAGITEQLNGIKDIKSNILEETQLKDFSSTCKRMEENVVNFSKLYATSQFTYKAVSAVLVALFVFLAIKLFQAQTTELMLIVIIFSRLWPRFTGIQSNLEQIGSIIPSFEALIDLQRESMLNKELQDEYYKNVESLKIESKIECNNVSFKYKQDNSSFSLKSIYINIPVNKMTAVVGKSGAGKTTLVDVIMGLNKPDRGEVLIDGTSISGDNLVPYRRSISYVTQDSFLFNKSIRENLLLTNPTASQNEIWQALQFSSAADFVSSLPEGLDTLVGDRGIRLSGGERQRIVLARAILRNPQILILDEATSALDTENESKIQEAIDRLKGKMTIIVIAHRLSTIRNADQVIVLDKGKVIQSGEFYELAKEKKGMFSTLLGNQMRASV
ncbi:ABC transporter ATP-binding protein [Bacillus timonensis]|uniref:ABC transporter ATP-binding protein n=1 Tax=Bacillus timonensis TaxID=1033734 RepID=UPI0002899600|nr:ABC transporter ATP-binding protein [Bacillus timonensis]